MAFANRPDPVGEACKSGDITKLKAIFFQYPNRLNGLDENGDTPLHQAVYWKQPAVIKYLLNKGANSEARNEADCTPLYEAVRLQSLECVQALCSKSADPNSQNDEKERTPLHLASELGNEILCDELLNFEANASEQDTDGNTPLHLAFSNTSSGVAHKLIIALTNANVQNKAHHTPLVLAIASQNKEAVKLLLKKGSKLTTRTSGIYPLHIAFYKGSVPIIGDLLSFRANILDTDYSGNSVLHFAALGDSTLAIKFLLDKNVPIDTPNMDCFTAFHIAVVKGHSGVTSELLKQGCSTDLLTESTHNAFHLACYNGAISICNQLIDKGMSVDIKDSFNNTPLHYAVLGDKLPVVQFLISNKARLNLKNSAGWTPLLIAIQMGLKNCIEKLLEKLTLKDEEVQSLVLFALKYYKSEICEILLSHMKNINFINAKGFSLLHYSALKGNLPLLELLLKKGANVLSRSSKNCLALHYAVRVGNIDCLKLLCVSKSTLNAQTLPNCQSPLHIAALIGSLNITKQLIQAGATIKALDKEGLTPFDYAIIKNRTALIEFYIKIQGDLGKSSPARSSLFNAIRYGSFDSFSKYLKELKDKKALEDILETVDTQNNTLLLYAVKKKRWRIVEILVELGASRNAKDIKGNTSLYYLLQEKNRSPIKAIEKCAFIPKLIHDDPELRWAELAVACYLVQAGANVYFKNKNNISAQYNIGDTIEEIIQAHRKLRVLPVCDMCDRRKVQVLFEPCLHNISCKECSLSLPKCFKCKTTITNRIDEEGKTVIFVKKEEKPNCPICLDNYLNTVFQCGHNACSECARKITMCHMCRKPIITRTSLYI